MATNARKKGKVKTEAEEELEEQRELERVLSKSEKEKEEHEKKVKQDSERKTKIARDTIVLGGVMGLIPKLQGFVIPGTSYEMRNVKEAKKVTREIKDPKTGKKHREPTEYGYDFEIWHNGKKVTYFEGDKLKDRFQIRADEIADEIKKQEETELLNGHALEAVEEKRKQIKGETGQYPGFKFAWIDATKIAHLPLIDEIRKAERGEPLETKPIVREEGVPIYPKMEEPEEEAKHIAQSITDFAPTRADAMASTQGLFNTYDMPKKLKDEITMLVDRHFEIPASVEEAKEEPDYQGKYLKPISVEATEEDTLKMLERVRKQKERQKEWSKPRD